MTIEELIDLQEAGSRARARGLQQQDNPYLASERISNDDASALGDWRARHDAWQFEWESEDASRDGRVARYFKELISTSLKRPVSP
jgi:hypothetical protein